MLSPTRKSVVKRSMVGKTENSSGVFTYIAIISMRNESVRFAPISVSTSGVGNGMIMSAITTTMRTTMATSLCRAIEVVRDPAF